MPTIASIRSLITDAYSRLINQMAVEGIALAHGNSYTGLDPVNAIVHTQVSAASAYIYGDEIARRLGDFKEIPSDPSHYSEITVTVYKFPN